MDWIVKCRYVKDKDTNKLKREIIRICPKCKDKRKITRMNHKSKDERMIDVSKMYDYECPVCGQIMEREGYGIITDMDALDILKSMKMTIGRQNGKTMFQSLLMEAMGHALKALEEKVEKETEE